MRWELVCADIDTDVGDQNLENAVTDDDKQIMFTTKPVDRSKKYPYGHILYSQAGLKRFRRVSAFGVFRFSVSFGSRDMVMVWTRFSLRVPLQCSMPLQYCLSIEKCSHPSHYDIDNLRI